MVEVPYQDRWSCQEFDISQDPRGDVQLISCRNLYASLWGGGARAAIEIQRYKYDRWQQPDRVELPLSLVSPSVPSSVPSEKSIEYMGNTAISQERPSVATDSTGRTYAAFTVRFLGHDTYRSYYYVLAPAGWLSSGNWSPPHEFGKDSRNGQVANDRDGRVFMLWQEQRSVWVRAGCGANESAPLVLSNEASNAWLLQGGGSVYAIVSERRPHDCVLLRLWKLRG
jgi:hypothetical protein